MAAAESKYGELVPAKTESDELYDSIEKMVNTDAEKKQAQGCSNQPSTPCIFRVPESLRKRNTGAYTSRVVSIGPLNRCDERFKDHKVSYMNALFARTVNSQETMRQCGDAMLEMVPCARACYAESFQLDCSKIMFAQMMILDSCFILELLFRSITKSATSTDPILGIELVLGDVKHDLLLLENQIPYFVLQLLFSLTLRKVRNRGGQVYHGIKYFFGSSKLSLDQIVLLFFADVMIFESKMMTDNEDVMILESKKMADRVGATNSGHDHILALLHKCYKPADDKDLGERPVMNYSATQLNRAGVNFKATKGENYWLLVKFRTSCLFSWLRTLSQILSSWLLRHCYLGSTQRESTPADLLPVLVPEEKRNHHISTNWFSFSWLPKTSSTNCCLVYWLCQLCGTTCLEIPPLSLYDITESSFRNFIAYEQCSPNIPRYMTSYALLMDTLINSKDDVELLERENVLENNLGASEDASRLFNDLCKEINIGDLYYATQWNHLNGYCKRYWPRHLASLRRTYFSNPWSLISFIAALLLFALAATQTAYTVMSYRSS